MLAGCVVGPDDGRKDDGGTVDAAKSCDTVSFDATDPRLPCDVEAILVAKCQRCHNTPAVIDACYAAHTCAKGPFPLLSWQDTHQVVGSEPVFERMKTAISTDFMPLQITTIMPPVEKLTDAEKARLLDWLSQCAPPSDGVDCPHPDGSVAP